MARRSAPATAMGAVNKHVALLRGARGEGRGLLELRRRRGHAVPAQHREVPRAGFRRILENTQLEDQYQFFVFFRSKRNAIWIEVAGDGNPIHIIKTHPTPFEPRDPVTGSTTLATVTLGCVP